MHLPDAKKCTFRRNGVILPTACCGEKNAHSSENSAAKKRTFRRNGVILLLACCGEKVHLPDAKKSTFRRKGVAFPNACCGEKVHIPMKRCDFACCCLLASCKMRFFSIFELNEIGKFSGEKAHIPKE